MNNDLKKGFLTGVGGLLGVLSISAVIYIIYFLIKSLSEPTILFLQKKEYKDRIDCLNRTVGARDREHKKLHEELLIDGKPVSFHRQDDWYTIVQLQNKYCGEKPKKWKWQ